MASGSRSSAKNWPQDIEYLVRPTFSKRLDKPFLQALGFKRENKKYVPTGSGNIVIKKIVDSAHPACGEYGLFGIKLSLKAFKLQIYAFVLRVSYIRLPLASKPLSPGSHILDYLGHYHEILPEDTDETSDYDLVLARDVGATGRGIAIDARYAGNEARMINDYRGVAVKPNAEFRERDDSGIMGVFVVVNNGVKGFKGIKKGEEILVSYGRSFWSERKE